MTTAINLSEILRLHALCLAGEPEGKLADLSGVDLRYVDLSGVDLRYANLTGAMLDSANLTGANLFCADLADADLTDAILDSANLHHANLVRANLRHANLTDAILDSANLRDADLSGANLTDAALHDAALTDAVGLPDLAVPGLAAQVLAQIEAHPETHNQDVWHSTCGTKHCAAGWAVLLGGPDVQAAEQQYGTANAAWLALGRPAETRFGSDDDPLPWLRELAAAEELPHPHSPKA